MNQSGMPPRARLAVIGGAVTRGMRFPEDLRDPDVTVVATRLVYQTPYGPTAPFKHLRVRRSAAAGGGAEDVLFLRYLGVFDGASRTRYVEAGFWALEQAGVQRIVVDDNMGSLNPLLDPGDVVVCHDYVDFHKEASLAPLEGKLVRMRDPFCTELRRVLYEGCRAEGFPRVFRRGVYAVSHGTRFESPTEISIYQRLGGDIVGYSVVPAIYLARAMGACYAGIYLVSNYGEGLIEDWEHDAVWRETDSMMPGMARVLLSSLKTMPVERSCRCAEYCSPRGPRIMDFADR
ncbi:MAG: phosphorylase [Chloroflexota bacterium]